MRSVHSADLEHLAFVDGFGLTRVSLPRRVKTVRRPTAGLDAALSVNAARTELLAFHPWGSAYGRLTFPAMTAPEEEGDVLAAAALVPGGVASVTPPLPARATGTLSFLRDLGDTPVVTTLDLASAPVREGVSFGEVMPGWRTARLVSSPSGVWATLFDAETTLLVGDFSSPEGRLRWSAPARLPREALVTLHPFDDGRVVLALFSPSRRESTLVRFDPEGNTLGQRVVPSLGPAVPLSPSLVLHQISPDAVAQTPLDGGVARVTEIPAEQQGVGRVFGVEGAAFFLPWHAEAVVDLRTAAVIPRGLPAAHATARRWMRTHLARANALGNPGGILFELVELTLRPAKKNLEFTVDTTAGDGALLGVLAAGMLTGVSEGPLEGLPGWRCVYAGDVLPEVDPGRWDDAEVDAAFGALESARVDPWTTLGCFGDAYGQSYNLPEPGLAPFTRDGARRFLAGLTWALENPGRAGVREASRALAPSLTAAHVARALRGLPDDRAPGVAAGTLGNLVVLAGEVLREALPAVIEALCHVPEAWREGIETRLAAAVRWARSADAAPEVFSQELVRASRASPSIEAVVRGALK